MPIVHGVKIGPRGGLSLRKKSKWRPQSFVEVRRFLRGVYGERQGDQRWEEVMKQKDHIVDQLTTRVRDSRTEYEEDEEDDEKEEEEEGKEFASRTSSTEEEEKEEEEEEEEETKESLAREEFKWVVGSLGQQPRMALVPHAGYTYAGEVRRVTFASFRPEQVEKIYYLATLHAPESIRTDDPQRSSLSTTMRWWCTTTTTTATTTTEHVDSHIPYRIEGEHSYTWVEKEMRDYFYKATSHCVIYPRALPESQRPKLVSFLVERLRRELHSIVIGTTDLTHHGRRFGYTYTEKGSPWRLVKIREEEKLIEALVHSSPTGVDISLRRHPHTSDAHEVLRTMVEVGKELGMRGKVTDYYDSASVVVEDKTSMSRPMMTTTTTRSVSSRLDRYSVFPPPPPPSRTNVEFVSYVGIVYAPEYALRCDQIVNNFDIWQALGVIRSTIEFKLDSRRALALFPRWSVWREDRTRECGVFVGSDVNGKTNCSYGQFPSTTTHDDDDDGDKTLKEGERERKKKEKKSTKMADTLATKIVHAASHCQEDATRRWKIPYPTGGGGGGGQAKIIYKLEILEPEKEWEWIRGTEQIQRNVTHLLSLKNPDDFYGVQLIIPSIGSATYLPSVAHEWKSDATAYLSSLTKKLGGRTGSEWRQPGTQIGVYRTRAYYSEPHR